MWNKDDYLQAYLDIGIALLSIGTSCVIIRFILLGGHL